MITHARRDDRFSPAQRSLMRRRGPVLRALAVTAIVVMVGVGVVQASGPSTLPSSVNLEQWETKPDGGWITGALQQNNSDYMEGEAVPFRLDIPSKIDAGAYQFSVCRNYDDGTHRGYLYIAPFNTDRPHSPAGPSARQAMASRRSTPRSTP